MRIDTKHIEMVVDMVCAKNNVEREVVLARRRVMQACGSRQEICYICISLGMHNGAVSYYLTSIAEEGCKAFDHSMVIYNTKLVRRLSSVDKYYAKKVENLLNEARAALRATLDSNSTTSSKCDEDPKIRKNDLMHCDACGKRPYPPEKLYMQMGGCYCEDHRHNHGHELKAI